MLALTKDGVKLPPRVTGRTWAGLYERLGNVARGVEWAERLRAYLRAAEVRLAREGYLTEGTLTMFDGFKFSADNPYTYGEAKRLLNLGDGGGAGRIRSLRRARDGPAHEDVAGTRQDHRTRQNSISDFLPLRHRPKGGGFTKYPHLTLSVRDSHLEVAVTIPTAHPPRSAGVSPNWMWTARRASTARSSSEQGPHLRRRLGRGIRAAASLQGAPPSHDGREGVVQAGPPQPRGGGRVKHQPEWWDLFASLLKAGKHSNIQFGYVVKLPWNTPKLNSREALRLIVAGWSTLEPLLDVLRGKTT